MPALRVIPTLTNSGSFSFAVQNSLRCIVVISLKSICLKFYEIEFFKTLQVTLTLHGYHGLLGQYICHVSGTTPPRLLSKVIVKLL